MLAVIKVRKKTVYFEHNHRQVIEVVEPAPTKDGKDAITPEPQKQLLTVKGLPHCFNFNVKPPLPFLSPSLVFQSSVRLCPVALMSSNFQDLMKLD